MESKNEVEPLQVEELLEVLFLPKLKYDLDSVPIENELFVDYQANVETNLPLLFDFLQQRKQLIYENEKVHSTLVLLLCELATDTTFQTKKERLLKNVRRLLDEQQLPVTVENLVFDYYRVRLKPDVWKKHLGAMHGFVTFLAYFFNGKTGTKMKLEDRWLNFSLAVALNIRDCHELTCKQLGIQIFLIILNQARPKAIRELNVHSVIYESVLKDVHSTENTAAVTNIYDCLLLCFDFFDELDSINWSKVDDLLEILLRNIPLTNDAEMSVCLLAYVTKLCAFFTLNRKEILQKAEGAFLMNSSSLEDCRSACVSNTSYTIFRWAKNILEMIIFECHKLMQASNTFLELLSAMHKCYLVAVLPIPVNVVEPHLISFCEKFTAVLMEAIVVHKKQSDVIKASRKMLDTFLWQLKRGNSDTVHTPLSQLQQALEALSQNNVFINEII